MIKTKRPNGCVRRCDMDKLNVWIPLVLISMLALCYADKQKVKDDIEIVKDTVEIVENIL